MSEVTVPDTGEILAPKTLRKLFSVAAPERKGYSHQVAADAAWSVIFGGKTIRETATQHAVAPMTVCFWCDEIVDRLSRVGINITNPRKMQHGQNRKHEQLDGAAGQQRPVGDSAANVGDGNDLGGN